MNIFLFTLSTTFFGHRGHSKGLEMMKTFSFFPVIGVASSLTSWGHRLAKRERKERNTHETNIACRLIAEEWAFDDWKGGVGQIDT